MTSKDLLNAVHDNTALVNDKKYQLHLLARSFEITGNTKIAEDLYHIAEMLVISAKEVQDAYGAQLNADIRHSHETTMGLMHAVVVGIGIGKKEASK